MQSLNNLDYKFELFSTIENELEKVKSLEYNIDSINQDINRSQMIQNIIHTSNYTEDIQIRILNEFFNYGPISDLIEDEFISEILINSQNDLYFEKNGILIKHSDCFLSEFTYLNFVEKLKEEARCHTTIENPIAQGTWRNFRVQIVDKTITQKQPIISLRSHPKNPWSLDKLQSHGMFNKCTAEFVKSLVRNKKNIIIAGTTGTGKTSILSACLAEIPKTERAIVIEDSSEISLPNSASIKLLTRSDSQNILREITQTDLVKSSLRLRPDRLIIGEIRGAEAKDLLLALSTGHSGSLCSLHATTPHQALLRLEMLIQTGAPFWSLHSIRSLIKISVDYIFMISKNEIGQRQLEGVYQISSLEDTGFCLERIH